MTRTGEPRTTSKPLTWKTSGRLFNLNMASLDEFADILGAEVRVELVKLREAARFGCPESIRGEVWKYLLGVQQADQAQTAQELGTLKRKYQAQAKEEFDDADVVRRIRGEASRYQKAREKFFEQKNIQHTLEAVVSAFVQKHHVNYTPQMIPLCGPFVACLATEFEIYFCFERLQAMMDEYFAAKSLSQRLAQFHLQFRSLLPELHHHFEEEEIEFREWATAWFQNLLSKELPIDCVLRLWDAYFSSSEGLELHLYVGLAVLKFCQGSMDELEHSEIRAHLLRIPNLDMDQIISLAYSLRDEVAQRLGE